MAAIKLSPSECETLAAKIANLTNQYELLITGGAARVLVDQNGERIEFTAGNAPRLATYIKILETRYSEGCTLRRVAIARPILPFF